MRRRLTYSLFLTGILVHLVLVLSLRTGFLNPLFNDSMHRFGPACDFFSIYAAGVKARLGEPVFPVGGHVEQVPYAYAFRYLPLVAYTLGWGLSWLPAVLAYGLWLILCELALLRNIRLTWELAPDRETRYLGAALWLLFSPYYLELFVGQFTFVTASLIFWAYLAWQHQPLSENAAGERHWTHRLGRFCREHAGDAFWTAAVLLKLMPWIYLPLLWLRGRTRAAVTAAVLTVTTSWLYFARVPSDWALFTDVNANPLPTWHAGNQGLLALLFAVVGEQREPYLAWRMVILAVVGAALLWLTYGAWRAGKELRSTGKSARRPAAEDGRERWLLYLYAACSAAYFLIYKDVWEHHYVLLLPPLVLLALRREPVWLWGPAFLITALPGLFVLYDIPGIGYNEDPQRYWGPELSVLHRLWKPLSPLWLLGGLLWQSARVAAWSVPGVPSGEPGKRGVASGRRALRWAWRGACVVLIGTVGLGVGNWALATIRQQRQTSRELVWSPAVFQRQQRREACGPAALAAVCRYYGIPASEEEIARLAGTTQRGTSMLGLQKAAATKGLIAEGRNIPLQELSRVPRPCILFYSQGHFAVLTGVRDGLYYLADPSLGQRVWPAEMLRQRWRGEVLVVGPAPN